MSGGGGGSVLIVSPDESFIYSTEPLAFLNIVFSNLNGLFNPADYADNNDE